MKNFEEVVQQFLDDKEYHYVRPCLQDKTWRRLREQYLEDLGFEDPSPEQRSHNLATSMALNPWPQETTK